MKIVLMPSRTISRQRFRNFDPIRHISFVLTCVLLAVCNLHYLACLALFYIGVNSIVKTHSLCRRNWRCNLLWNVDDIIITHHNMLFKDIPPYFLLQE